MSESLQQPRGVERVGSPGEAKELKPGQWVVEEGRIMKVVGEGAKVELSGKEKDALAERVIRAQKKDCNDGAVPFLSYSKDEKEFRKLVNMKLKATALFVDVDLAAMIKKYGPDSAYGPLNLKNQ